MGGAPVVETVRAGVQFTPAAAASFRRAEAGWREKTGSGIGCNSTYRDYGLQMSMWQAWEAWVQGRGPKPNHSRAVHPDASRHTTGLALDTNLWTQPGFVAHMERHGWVRTAAWDPTELHHFEYQSWRDQHRNDPAPGFAGGGAAPIEEEDDMAYIANVKNGNFYCVTGTKAHKLGAKSNARRSGMPIIDYPDDWAVGELKRVVSGIGNH